MSNVGKQRILLPRNITIKTVGWKIYISGKNGTASITFPPYTRFIVTEAYVCLINPSMASPIYGTLQRKLQEIIHGLALKYTQIIEFVGVGYRPRIENNSIIIRLGFSHEVSVPIPSHIEVELVKRNILKIRSSNFTGLREFAYKLRSYRPPEPFKGKGIVCVGEKVRRKEGKKKQI